MTARTKASGRERAITDKERLDWLERNAVWTAVGNFYRLTEGGINGIEPGEGFCIDIRQAIDAAIRASRKKPK